MLEKKKMGELEMSGSWDVLSLALETPEHTGRVRGVGGSVTPKAFFNLPKTRNRVTKAELMARDQQRDEEMEKTKKELAELRALITANTLHSPNLSDKGSFQAQVEGEGLGMKMKPAAAKELVVDEGEDCVAIDPPPPSEKKVKQTLSLMSA